MDGADAAIKREAIQEADPSASTAEVRQNLPDSIRLAKRGRDWDAWLKIYLAEEREEAKTNKDLAKILSYRP